MSSIKSSTRLALTIGVIVASVIWCAVGLNIIPDPYQDRITGRMRLAESTAIHAAIYVQGGKTNQLEMILKELVRRDNDLISVGVRKNSQAGELALDVNGHRTKWEPLKDGHSTGNQMAVDIIANDKRWGTLELSFVRLPNQGLAGFMIFPMPMVIFCGALTILLNWTFLSRTLRHLNPSRVVPARVRSALDSISDGLILIDKKQTIVLANEAFAKIVGQSCSDLQGKRISDFKWGFAQGSKEPAWIRALNQSSTQRGDVVSLPNGKDHSYRFTVNATPIFADKGQIRGVLTSFHDVTMLENKKEQLADMLSALKCSRDEVQKKNRDLQVLASIDSLTGCLNRRAFFEQFDTHWNDESDNRIAAVMIDIDHFKLINDNHGHGTGDIVLREISKIIREAVGDSGVVCRYGGEEFAVAYPKYDIESCSAAAEGIQDKIRAAIVEELKITVSMGVSARDQGAMDGQHLLDQADQCLYVAKRRGRNQIARWDLCDKEDLARDHEPSTRVTEASKPVESAIINYPAVTALLSALAFRDRKTAEHSSRVACLSVAIGKRMLATNELYELEIAALLHDVGKIGVPDAILLKPDRLTEAEWKIMNRHDEIGIEIIRSALASERIADIIRMHYSREELQDSMTHIPLASRIISVCDAYDSMTHDCVFREAKSQNEALKELVHCSPDQFDPNVVEALIEIFSENPEFNSHAGSFVVSQRTVVEMGVFIEQFIDSIAAGDLDRLRNVTQQLGATASSNNIQPVMAATTKLETALGRDDAELENLVELANEVLDLCRSSRHSLVEKPDLYELEQLAKNISDAADGE